MYRLILVIIYAFLVSLTLSGCLGLAVSSPDECENETPYTGVHDIFGHSKTKQALTPKASTKADFLKEWGEPDKIIPADDNEEILIYERNLWCGVIPIVIIPIPLVLPVCDGFDRIYFMGNEAKRLHTRHTSTGGFFITMMGGGVAESDPPCKYPIPFESTDSKGDKPPHPAPLTSVPSFSIGDKIPDNAGLVVFYRPTNFLGSSGIHTVHAGENFMVPLYNGSYYPYPSILGEKEFWVQSGFTRTILKINVKSGQTYYIRFRMGFFKVYFEEMAAEIAKQEIADLKLITPP